MRKSRKAFCIAGIEIMPGKRQTVEIPVAKLYNSAEQNMAVHIVHGKSEGSTLFISAAIHGDEINGVEIIRRLLHLKLLNSIRGTLLAVPVVNAFGFINNSRYLPDRRDLNRFFPGSEKGSLTSRVAYIFMQEVVSRASYGIDFHSASSFKNNLPQIRADMDDEKTQKMAQAFGAPIIIDAKLRDGSLRQAATEQGVKILLYEGGQAMRLDEIPIKAGMRGAIAVMRYLGMLPKSKKIKNIDPVISHHSTWARVDGSGIFLPKISLGQMVYKDQIIGIVTDPLGENKIPVTSPAEGIIIGSQESPLVHKGDAVCHIAITKDIDAAEVVMDKFQREYEIDIEKNWL